MPDPRPIAQVRETLLERARAGRNPFFHADPNADGRGVIARWLAHRLQSLD